MAEHATAPPDTPVAEVIIERFHGLVMQLAHEVDPALEVRLTPYVWHGEPVLDIALGLHGHWRHLEVTADRLAIAWRDHDILKHDIEEHVHQLHALPAEEHTKGSSEPVARAATASVPAPSPAHAAPAAPDGRATRLDAERAALAGAKELARHIVAELEPAAQVHFDEYHWHGALTLDVRVTLHGHDHHYEVTAERARLFLRDPAMLHHDLEGVLAGLRREAAAPTGPEPGTHR